MDNLTVILSRTYWTVAIVAITFGCDTTDQPRVAAPTDEALKPPTLTSHREQKDRITFESLERMFANMRSDAGWYKDGDLLWGYFFTDPDPTKLERAAEKLKASGYTFVSIYPTDDGSTYFLHVEKVETHNPRSLHVRNDELYKLADDLDLESYDGMDVGPTSPR